MNQVRLSATQLPPQTFGFFLTADVRSSGLIPPGSVGRLCLAGQIGRYVRPGQIKNAGSAGTFALDLDLNSHPVPTGVVPVMAGETWHFQAWFRDVILGSQTSNFTDALSVVFY